MERMISGGHEMMLLDEILMSIILIASGILVILLLKFAKENPKEWLWAMRRRDYFNILGFAEKLQPKENRALLSRRKKRSKDEKTD